MSKGGQHLKFSTRSEEQEYWALRPIKQKLQPNEIITKEYSPDVTPQVKLIVNNDQRKNNVNFIPPKVKNHQLQNYAHPFNQFDYLGNYCAKKINQLVYLKFYNNKYNMMADCKQRTRVMPAFYVPFQQIYSEQQHLFTKKLGFKFPQNDPDSVLPVQKNNRGCAFDPLFCSQFETGNLFAAIRKSPFDYELILQNDVNNCMQVGWFNFSIQFFTQGYYSFCIKNMTKNMMKVYKRGLRIFYCFLNNLNQSCRNQTLDDWNQIGENIQFRQNGIEIQSQPGEYYYDLYFEYKCKNKHQIVAFAMEKPYNTLDAQNYFTKIAPKKLRGLTKIERVQYGKTMSGTPLVAYLIKKRRAGSDLNLLTPNQAEGLSNAKSRKSINMPSVAGTLFTPDNRHKTVFIIGRLAPQDISSSYLIEGMVDFLLDTMDYDILKRTVNFYFIPQANIDGVKYGNSLTNLSGSNLFDCWKNPHKIYQAEIYYLKSFMNEINKDYPISHVFNFSSEFNEIYSSVIGTKNENQQTEDSRIFPYVLSKRHKMFQFEEFYFYDKGTNTNTMTCILTEQFPNVLAYQFKISRFQFEKQPEETSTAKPQTSNLKQCSSKSYFNFGRKFMEDFLQHIKIYQKNSLLKNKWMRDIQEIQQFKPKAQPIILVQRPVQERFHERFYLIKNASVKASPAKLGVKAPKRFDPYSLSRRSKRTNQNTADSPLISEHRNLVVRYCFADLNKKKKQFEMRAQSLDENIRKTLGKVFEKSFNEKPSHPQFRIKEKTHEVLKNCTSNMVNFEMGIVSQQKLKKETNSPYIQKQKLKKKEQSLKQLKKVKNNDLVQGLNKDRSLMFMKP